jgi:hypothetical protein
MNEVKRTRKKGVRDAKRIRAKQGFRGGSSEPVVTVDLGRARE